MKVAIIQSNYIPWKGYFDIIHDVDLFIFYDDVQFTKNDWRNRNKIKTPNGTQWLTIPVGQDINRLISEVTIDNSLWQGKHWKTLQHNYQKAPYFYLYQEFFEDFYLKHTWTNLSVMNQYLIKHIAMFLGIDVQFKNSDEYSPVGKKQERILDILTKANATTYVSGDRAKSYIDQTEFDNLGITLTYKSYLNYPEYQQLSQPFDHYVSIVDLLFNCGTESASMIWDWRN
jgi:hypothetical protein